MECSMNRIPRVGHQCGCKPKCHCRPTRPCGCNTTPTDPCDQCENFMALAEQKCEEATGLRDKANILARQALNAEERARALKQQAIDECDRANLIWDEYQLVAEESMAIMDDAQALLAKASECFENCFEEDFGCNIDELGPPEEPEEPEEVSTTHKKRLHPKKYK